MVDTYGLISEELVVSFGYSDNLPSLHSLSDRVSSRLTSCVTLTILGRFYEPTAYVQEFYLTLF